jgi:2,3-bisphosphoglycerate-independent phosphoglycerate mutase
MLFNQLKPLIQSNNTKLVLLVLDGLGGLPIEPGGKTELETAHTPHMDRLAAEGALGRTIPIRPGITPGSGPAHLSLFGYDPLVYDVGRGVLEAAGVNLSVNPGDISARGNFCTLDAQGNITDRRAGRISTQEASPIVESLKSVQIPGVEVEVAQLLDYRFAIVMRGPSLHPDIEDTDPQKTSAPPLLARAVNPAAQHTADLFNQWTAKAHRVIANQPRANGLTLRGFSTDPNLPKFPEVFGLRAACIAEYPMYRGVASLVGMDIIEFAGNQPADEFATTAQVWDQYDFFFIHIKKTDSKGEDGNFNGKVEIIESVDQALPTLMALKPDVLMITGDHSTPAKMKSHSWHPVPFLLWAPALQLPDQQTTFGERACLLGELGTFPATRALPLALAHAGRLAKFGA